MAAPVIEAIEAANGEGTHRPTSQVVSPSLSHCLIDAYLFHSSFLILFALNKGFEINLKKTKKQAILNDLDSVLDSYNE